MRACVNKQVQSCCLSSTPGIAKSPLIRRTCSTQVRAVHDTRATRAVHPDVLTARRHAMLPSGGFATPLSKWRNLPNAISQSGRYSYSTAPVDATQPVIHDVFESNTGTWQYVVADPATKAAVIIDPVLDYDRTTQIITTSSADELLRLVKEKSYRVLRILETHAHADHLTAASYLQKRIAEEHGNKPQIGIGRRIGQVQDLFGQRYDVSSQERHGVFDKLFEDDESFSIGHLSATAIHLPGHTPDHLGYKIGGKAPETPRFHIYFC